MKQIVITLIVAVALLVAADFAAASVAEYQVSNRLKEQLALPAEPDVRITGFPFLTQAFAGDYRKIEVYAEKLDVGELTNVGVMARLYHVRVPFTQVVNGSVAGLTVDEAQGSVLITKDDLARLLPGVTKLRVEPVDAAALDRAAQDAGQATAGSTVIGIDPDRAVRMVATTSILGQEVNTSVIAELRLSGGEVQLVPRDIRLGSGSDAAALPRIMQSGLRQVFTLRIDPGALPFGMTPTMLKAVDNALEVSGSGRDLVIGNPDGTTSTSR
ncbi:MAG: LmeA family phospholipid-binding protein [Pseudonocardia sp.]|jgi:hypothetical protein